MTIARPSNAFEHRVALARLIDQPGTADGSIEHRVDLLEDYARKRRLSLDNCLMIRQGDSVEAVCLCLDSPGRTSSVLLSPGIANVDRRGLIVEMLAQAELAAARRGVQLLQGMVPPECSSESLVYAAAGFKHLAKLIYMQAQVGAAKARPSAHRLTWETYSPQTHALFARVVEQTYEGSLDCGSLNGLRHIEDILASHKATGRFDPQDWRIGMAASEPVGVILLGYVEEQQAYEVIYVGCIPRFRGQHYGSSLLAHGLDWTRSRGCDSVTLSVDEKNTPARKLYKSFGFREVTRRDVWIRLVPASTGIQR